MLIYRVKHRAQQIYVLLEMVFGKVPSGVVASLVLLSCVLALICGAAVSFCVDRNRDSREVKFLAPITDALLRKTIVAFQKP